MFQKVSHRSGWPQVVYGYSGGFLGDQRLLHRPIGAHQNGRGPVLSLSVFRDEEGAFVKVTTDQIETMWRGSKETADPS